MKLVTYEIDRGELLGVMSENEEWIYPLQAFDMEYKTMLEAVKSMSDSELQLLSHASGKDAESIRGAVCTSEVNLLSPIPCPDQDIICLGINYMEHAAESARFKKESFDGERPYAVYFSKRVNSTTATGSNIPSYALIVDSLDYEAELAVIIGQDAKNISPEDAKNYIFGYTILNDVSARNIQNRHKQWYFGKSLDGFAPMGPCILTADSIAYPPELDIQSYVNGELRQNSNTRQLIFNLDHIISELSQGMTLKAGTIISTGTPSGVGLGFDPPKFLKSGDTVECRIESIGSLINKVE